MDIKVRIDHSQYQGSGQLPCKLEKPPIICLHRSAELIPFPVKLGRWQRAWRWLLRRA